MEGGDRCSTSLYSSCQWRGDRNFLNGPPHAERPLSNDHNLYFCNFSAMRSCQSSKPSNFKDSGLVVASIITTNGGGFKDFKLDPSREKNTAFPKSDFDPTLHSPLATSGFARTRKPNKSLPCFSVIICLLLSLLFVLSTTGFYPSPHVFGLNDLVSRTFGIKNLDSEKSTATKLVVDPMSKASIPKSTARSSQVQFDNYSLILGGQRIFL